MTYVILSCSQILYQVPWLTWCKLIGQQVFTLLASLKQVWVIVINWQCHFLELIQTNVCKSQPRPLCIFSSLKLLWGQGCAKTIEYCNHRKFSVEVFLHELEKELNKGIIMEILPLFIRGKLGTSKIVCGDKI